MAIIRSGLAIKIVLLLALLVGASLFGAGAYSYFSLVHEVETNLGKRLLSVAKTASLMIPAEAHETVKEQYLEGKTDLEKTDAFLKLQSTLKKIKEVNNLKTDVYTMIHADWLDTPTVLFMGMSADKTYIGNGMKMNPASEKTFQQGIATSTKLYSDAEGEWVSAFAPIKNSKGKIIGVLELDYQADGEVWAAKMELFKNIGIPAALSLLLASILGWFFGRGIALPISSLAHAANKVAKGNFEVQVAYDQTTEVEVLSKAFNTMVHAIKKQQKELNDYSKNLEIKVDERTKEIREKDKVVYHNTKLASIGRLAAGVAHEVNNPLQIILGNTEILQSDLETNKSKETSGLKSIGKIQSSIHRIRSIVDGLRVYARNDSIDQENFFDIHDVVNSCYDLLSFLYKSQNVNIELQLEAEQSVLWGNKGRFQQALVNLISNAHDAMASNGGGQVRVSTKNESGRLLVSVSDNGTGIPKDLKEKIFDQFFTTKPVGEGTGLGLGIVTSIVNDMEGKIDVESAIGQGTTFILDFEAVNSTVVEPDENLEPFQYQELTGNVLVVDDEDNIREYLSELLKDLGLNVITAASAKEALEICKNHTFEVIITDIQMPEITGGQLIETLVSEGCNSKFLVITGEVGYNEDSNAEWRSMIEGLINKPFSFDSMYQTLLKHLQIKKKAS